MIALLIVIGLIVAIALYVIVTYNGFVSLRERIKESWSGIEVQMKLRYDLIPNLVETVKGYAKHEAGTFEAVVQARNSAMANHGSPAEQAQSENMLAGALKSLFALAENYPELKANENFMSLQGQLADVENKIQSARRYYNGVVRDNNIKIDQFPSNLVANAFNFIKAEFFELAEDEDAARKPVQVSFD
ncbi:LemA family protein [Sneathiella chungangensis]|uniref:LemA family protein n=1 Tax=Sneathiella chungangensis TaxID=1418234 RepID=A0A845MCK1_9PROT|nr:LemA family protein [Sneathiella chungangensis]MZR21708.1 LemA family protein [Sneathiella chungangensis]